MRGFLRLLLLSACLIAAIAALSVVYGFIAHRYFTPRYIFDANFLVGAVVILIGVLVMFLPAAVFTKVGKSLDRYTYFQRSLDDRETRQKKARYVLWVGILIMVLAGLAQILLSLVMR